MKASTAFALVKTIQSNVPTAAQTRSSGLKSSGGAMRMRIEGVIRLEAVVSLEGVPGQVTVTKCELQSRLQNSTNENDARLREALLESKFKPGECTETFGLDGAAVNAVKQWRFAPGSRDGKAVPVVVEIEMNFTLR